MRVTVTTSKTREAVSRFVGFYWWVVHVRPKVPQECQLRAVSAGFV